MISDIGNDKQEEKKQRELKEELDNIKEEVRKMKDSLGQSQELYRKNPRNNFMRDSDGKSMSKITSFGNDPLDRNSEDFINLKRKVKKNEVIIDDLDSKFKNLENDLKNKFLGMKENLESEIDALKLLKERVKTVYYI